MRTFVVVMLAVILFSTAVAGVASAQQYPNVANLKPFTAPSIYMSLPGYLRYLTYQQTNQWMTFKEASRVVSQQTGK